MFGKYTNDNSDVKIKEFQEVASQEAEEPVSTPDYARMLIFC